MAGSRASRAPTLPVDPTRRVRPQSPSSAHPANPTDPSVVHRLEGPTRCTCGGTVHESETVCSNGGIVA